jgi:outer membrane protein OmpA-like peptidoglycan-associated protein
MGVLAEEVDGRPKLSVYFDTAKADVAPDFATVAAPIKAYVDANPGARLAVSGYNDPRGDPAFNAELSKNRAQNVKAALVALGVPEGVIDLEKPAETTDATTTFENARRVDIMVKDAG